MIKLDAYDKKILEILLKNSKEPVTIISKKIRLGRENVDYKINRLIKEGIIKEPITIFNEESLRLTRYVFFGELINIKKDVESKILNYLKNNNHVSWIGIDAGKWSLIFDIILKEKDDFDKIISDFLSKFNNCVGEYVILRPREIRYFPEKMLNLNSLNFESPRKISEKLKIDETDIKILSILNENAWSNYVKIADKVGLTANAVNNRIKNLEKNHIILNYTLSLDWKRLGWELFGLQIKTIRIDNKINEKLISYLQKNKNVLFYYRYSGSVWDYNIGIIANNSEELREFINDFRNNFSEYLKISEVSIILKEVTGYKLPSGVFK